MKRVLFFVIAVTSGVLLCLLFPAAYVYAYIHDRIFGDLRTAWWR